MSLREKPGEQRTCAVALATLVFALAGSLCVTARAQTAEIPGGSAVSPAPPGTTAPAAPSAPPAPAVVPPFTPAPVRPFTPPGPSAPPPTMAPPFAPVSATAPPVLSTAPPVAPNAAATAVDEHPRDPRFHDAHVDRVVLVPTAETHPAGTFYVSDYDIALMQVGYAVSDRVDFTISGVPPLERRDPIALLDFSLKGVAVRADRFRLAAMASATGLVGFEETGAFAGRIGAVTELCFDDDCRSSANVAANALLGGRALLLLDGVGFVLRTTELVALLVEVQSLVPLDRDVGDAHGVGGALGVRLSGKRWAVDLAAEAAGKGTGKPLSVVPVVAATFRFLP